MANNLLSIIETIEGKMNIDKPVGSILPGEVCLDELLSIEEDDTININKLNSMTYLYELGDPNNRDELMYVESKIIKFLITEPYDMSECLDLYNITQEICNQGLSHELMTILAQLINLNPETPVGEGFDNKLKTVENRLGKYVPDIIKQIMTISELYEQRNCNRISQNTKILKLLYSRIIKKNTSHEDYKMPSMDISGFFESFQANIITKSILLLFIAYVIGRIINLFNVQYNIMGK